MEKQHQKTDFRRKKNEKPTLSISHKEYFEKNDDFADFFLKKLEDGKAKHKFGSCRICFDFAENVKSCLKYCEKKMERRKTLQELNENSKTVAPKTCPLLDTSNFFVEKPKKTLKIIDKNVILAAVPREKRRETSGKKEGKIKMKKQTKPLEKDTKKIDRNFEKIKNDDRGLQLIQKNIEKDKKAEKIEKQENQIRNQKLEANEKNKKNEKREISEESETIKTNEKNEKDEENEKNENTEILIESEKVEKIEKNDNFRKESENILPDPLGKSVDFSPQFSFLELKKKGSPFAFITDPLDALFHLPLPPRPVFSLLLSRGKRGDQADMDLRSRERVMNEIGVRGDYQGVVNWVQNENLLRANEKKKDYLLLHDLLLPSWAFQLGQINSFFAYFFSVIRDLFKRQIKYLWVRNRPSYQGSFWKALMKGAEEAGYRPMTLCQGSRMVGQMQREGQKDQNSARFFLKPEKTFKNANKFQKIAAKMCELASLSSENDVTFTIFMYDGSVSRPRRYSLDYLSMLIEPLKEAAELARA